MERRPSEIVEEIRCGLSKQRSASERLRTECRFADQLRDFEGLLTCGIVAAHHWKAEFTKIEIASDDRERGPHLSFRPRGIGTDSGAGCFVCGKALSFASNISAFTTKIDGEKIVEWFTRRSGGAWLDFRPSEPDWVQVKVMACECHSKNLSRLLESTNQYGVIRERDIDDAMAELCTACEQAECARDCPAAFPPEDIRPDRSR